MKCLPTVIAILLLMSTRLPGHPGPRIWIDNIGGKITTFTSDNDLNPTAYLSSRVFDTELLNEGVFISDFPGYEVVRINPQVSSGTTFGFNLVGPLLVYDDLAGQFVQTEAKYGPPQPGPVPELAVSRGDLNRFTGEGPVRGFEFFSYTGTGAHSHLSYMMIGDSLPINGPNGVYALPMQLTAAGLESSDPYLLLLGKGISPGTAEFDDAHDVAQAMIDRPGDANLDGIVNSADLGQIALHWQGDAAWPNGDFNFDGIVNLLDLVILATHWQNVAEPSAPVPSSSIPEPAALTLLGISALALLGCRWSSSPYRPILGA